MRAPTYPAIDADDEAFFAQPGITPEIIAGQIEARANKDFVRLRPDGTPRTIEEVQSFVREQAARHRAAVASRLGR